MDFIPNAQRVKYFKMQEYVDRISLNEAVLQHTENTNISFDNYIKLLSKLNANQRHYFLLEAFKDEIKKSNSIEKHIIDPHDIKDSDIFFDSLDITNQRIKELHSFAMRLDHIIDYRKDIAYISSKNPHTGKETIYWYGVEAEDIDKFMDDYIKIYKDTSLSLLSSSAFLKSAIIDLLFIKIHPFGDGNGRTARLLHEMKFTELINKLSETNLKICPLHISNSILNNRYIYASRLNMIYFDLEHECNDQINRWIDFCLTMADEQIYFLTNELNRIISCYGTDIPDDEELFQEKMKKIEQIQLENDGDVIKYTFKREGKKLN